MANGKDNNKAAEQKFDDALLDNVAGGSDNKKFDVGDAVVFDHVRCVAGLFTKDKKVGVITAINGKIYTIEADGKSYTVEERDVLRPGIVKIENGAFGGW